MLVDLPAARAKSYTTNSKRVYSGRAYDLKKTPRDRSPLTGITRATKSSRPNRYFAYARVYYVCVFDGLGARPSTGTTG